MHFMITEDVLRAHIRLILIQVWDPIGVKRFGIASEVDDLSSDPAEDDDMVVRPLPPLRQRDMPFGDAENEYDTYIPILQAMIIDRCSAKGFFDHLQALEVGSMERVVNDGVRRNAANRLGAVTPGLVSSRND